jgi:hypothetical protein
MRQICVCLLNSRFHRFEISFRTTHFTSCEWSSINIFWLKNQIICLYVRIRESLYRIYHAVIWSRIEWRLRWKYYYLKTCTRTDFSSDLHIEWLIHYCWLKNQLLHAIENVQWDWSLSHLVKLIWWNKCRWKRSSLSEIRLNSRWLRISYHQKSKHLFENELSHEKEIADEIENVLENGDVMIEMI